MLTSKNLTIKRLTMAYALALSLPCSVYADADGEREVLARLANEIEALEPLVAEAEQQASTDARIQFQYAWLRQDLSRVRSGIRDHVDTPRAEPRSVPPLRGDYRR